MARPALVHGVSPHISPIRLSLSDKCMLSMSYGGLFTMTSLHTALDAPSLVFLRLTGTCSLNHSHRYAFGPRIKYGAGSGAR